MTKLIAENAPFLALIVVIIITHLAGVNLGNVELAEMIDAIVEIVKIVGG